MSGYQLNLLADGAQPDDAELGVTQRAVMRVLRRVETLTDDEAGAIAHAGRSRHTADERCGFCGVDGRLILRSLATRGLAEPFPGGVRMLCPKPAAVPDDTDPFPPGF